MNIPTVDSLPIEGKRVIVRGDLDVAIDNGKVVSENRLENLLPTLKKVLEGNASKVIVIGHRGRPAQDNKQDLTLAPLKEWFTNKLEQEVGFMDDPWGEVPENKVVLIENLRYWEGEEGNHDDFVNQIASLGDVYVNDAFGSSHREHASIVGLAKRMPHAAGEQLSKEVSQLSRLLEEPERPFIVLLSGVKEDKLSYLDKLIEISDKVLVGGRLPEYLGDEYKHDKVVLGRLIQDKEDITLHTVEAFEREIARAKTILVSGPMGKFEEEGHRLGTQKVFEAIARAEAYKVAGGGDTEAAIKLLGMEESFDWTSTGGGAMLEFITKGTLPGIEVLLQ